MNKVPSESVGVLALMSGYALIGCAPSTARTMPQPENLRVSVPLSPLAQAWRGRRLVEEAHFDWENAQNRANASDLLSEWELVAMLDKAACIPSQGDVPVRIILSGVQAGEPHQMGMDEADYDFELWDSVKGNL